VKVMMIMMLGVMMSMCAAPLPFGIACVDDAPRRNDTSATKKLGMMIDGMGIKFS
jgi:hypothetical protein